MLNYSGLVEKLKNLLRNIQIVLKNIGLDFIKLKKIIYLKKYIGDYLSFKKLNGKVHFIMPILGEHRETNANFDKHYFYQETIVSSYIFQDNPNKHVDVGSRLSGFIGNVASYRNIEFFDLRSSNIKHDNITFKKIDLLDLPKEYEDYTDSLSCLYVIEHIGLGRYGDTINPDGPKVGYSNLIKKLKSKGKLYLAVPIGCERKTYFNAHKIFKPLDIVEWDNSIKLHKFDYVDDEGIFHKDKNIADINLKLLNYGCGIYTFIKD